MKISVFIKTAFISILVSCSSAEITKNGHVDPKMIRSGCEKSSIENIRSVACNPDMQEIDIMISRLNFYDRDKNPDGIFVNQFISNRNGTIKDEATGLIWQRFDVIGHDRTIGGHFYPEQYLRQLNEIKYGGYSDWRMPTIVELSTLIEREKKNELHISPFFHNSYRTNWRFISSDTQKSSWGIYYWAVDFKSGIICSINTFGGRLYYDGNLSRLKAVRSIDSKS